MQLVIIMQGSQTFAEPVDFVKIKTIDKEEKSVDFVKMREI